MTVNVEWVITNAEYSSAPVDGHEGVYVRVHFDVLATDPDNPECGGRTWGMVDLAPPTGDRYVPQDAVTRADLINWAKASMTADQVAHFEAGAKNNLQQQITPPLVSAIPSD